MDWIRNVNATANNQQNRTRGTRYCALTITILGSVQKERAK